MKKYFIKALKIISYIVLIAIGIFLLFTLLLQIPSVQNFAKEKAVAYLENKIKTKVKINRVEIGLPKIIILEGVYFEDQAKNILLTAKKLKVDISLIKLMDNKVEINSIDLNTVTANISRNRNGIFNFDYIIKAFKSQEKTKDISPPMEFSMDKINLDFIKFNFNDAVEKSNISVTLNHFDTKIKIFDLNNKFIEIKDFTLKNTAIALLFDKKATVKSDKNETAAANNWKIKIGQSKLENIFFKLDDNNTIAIENGIDYKHLNIKNLNLSATKLDYNASTISGSIASFAANEKSGLVIKNLKTDFYYGKKIAYLKNLVLKTPQTLVQDEIVIGYESVEKLSKDVANLDLNVKLKSSNVAVKDILLFAPTLSEMPLFADNKSAEIWLNTSFSGKLKSLTIPNFEMSGIGNTKVAFSGKIQGLPNFQNAFFDLKIKNITTTAKDIDALVPKNTIPTNIAIPNNLAISGNFKGRVAYFNTNFRLVSSFGNLNITNGAFNNQRKNRKKFIAQTEFYDFDLGKLIKNKSLGKISLKAKINGVGWNPKTANIKVLGTISKFYYNQYVYQNLRLNGAINDGLFDLKANSKDKNLQFDLASSGSFKNQYPSGKLNLDITIADLQKINLVKEPLKIHGKLNADVKTADVDFLNGTISLDNFIIANQKERFILDSINIIAVSTAKNKSIKMKSQFANAQISGNYKLSQIATAVENSLSKYYKFNTKSKNNKVQNQDFVIKVLVKESPILYKLIPNLKAIEPIQITGKFNSINDSIALNVTIPKLVYGENNITNAIIKIDKLENALVYNFFVDDVQNVQFQLPHTTLYGKLEDDVLDYNLQIKDIKNVDKYFIAGKLKTSNAISEIVLDPKKLLLNYENWTVSTGNKIRFGKNILNISDFELAKTGSAITVQSQSQQANAPIIVDFKDFQIATLWNIAQKNDLQIDGKINGNANIKNVLQTPLFTSDLQISDFVFKNTIIGDLSIQIDNNIANNYNTKIALRGQENQVHLDGVFQSTNNSINMILKVKKLNTKSIEAFSLDNIKEGSGFLSGNFTVAGSINKPIIKGVLQFNDVAFRATKFNAKFQSINDKIVFSENEIALNQFKIKDEKNNDLTIDGKINSADFSNLGFDLTIDATNFNAINSKEKDNNLYYGSLFLDNHLNVKGTSNSPIVDGSIKINKDTKFTIVLPQDDPSIADREGIIEFIDQDNPKLFGTLATDESLSQSEIKGINASVNIEIDKNAELSLIIDKANGDFLKLKGEARLNGGIDQSGKTTLTGRYDLTEGSYEMSFNLIKRKFDIKKGSFLLWTGEPTSADVNITAVYKLDTAPIDLLNDQLGTLSPATRNTYKQKIPFETQLKMKGDLLKPNISFDIVLPEGNNSVAAEIITATQAKLAQLRQEPDELNKQVFALLLLNRFIGENPFSSESGGTTAQGLARESASKILSQQLNNLASDLIKGVEIDFNLDATEDFTTGKKENKTDLNIGLSKTLLNDRLKVTVGSTFGVEGPRQENENQSTIAGDIAADYQLTKDGRYKVRAYRKNKFQVALQGQVVETGVGFIITIDYDKFKELFQKAKK